MVLRLAAALGLVLPVFAVAAAPAGAETTRIVLVTTNDLDRMEEMDGRGGFARLAAVVEERRAGEDAVLFLHAGDALSPSLLSSFDEGRHVIELLNMMRPDAFVPGNHEFDFGPEVFAERVAEAEFPVLAANMRTPDGRLPNGIAESLSLQIGDLSVGILGVMLDDVGERSTPGGWAFLPPLPVAERVAAALREAGADLVIAIAHTPLEQDLDFLRSGAFDVVVSGDDHVLTTLYDGRSLLVESGGQAEWIQVVTLSVEKLETSVGWRPRLVTIDSATVEPDPQVAARVAAYEQQLSRELDVELGRTSTELDSRRIAVRGRETTIGNLFADAMREMTGADAALLNGGGIRGDKVYPPGSRLTARDVLTELPFGNRTVLLEVTGAQLRRALENGLSQVDEVAGRFPQVSGLVVTADLSRPVGQRIDELRINGLPVDPAARYTLATNDFLAGGGDGYDVLTETETLVPASEAGLMAGQVVAYIRSIGYVAPQIEGRLRLK